jgi:hypothetical protein
MELEAEIDRLYGLPLDEFVRERDELARRLNREGDREAAARVKALRKPTVGAWALNQAVRRRRAETDALLNTGQRLRDAHEQLLSGGDPGVLRETMEEERSLTSALADCAEAIASETGKSGPALRDRVRSTLHAAAVDAEVREELATGRFVREREAVGLGSFGAGPAGDAPSAAPPAPKPGRSSAPSKRGGRSTQSPPGGERSAARRGAERSGTKPGPERSGTKPGAEGSAKRGAERSAKPRPARPEAPPAPDPRLLEAERLLAEAREALMEAEADHAATLSTVESARETLGQAELAEREARRSVRELWREVAKQERRVERLRPLP